MCLSSTIDKKLDETNEKIKQNLATTRFDNNKEVDNLHDFDMDGDQSLTSQRSNVSGTMGTNVDADEEDKI